MKIPIANLYYLLTYAWDILDEDLPRDVNAEDEHELLDLLARVLIHGTNDLLRRGIDRGYVRHEESIPGIRGKLLLTETLQRNLLQNARAYCAFDEFSEDVVHNQILRATFRSLRSAADLDKGLRSETDDLYRRLGMVSDIRLASSHFRRVQLHRNNATYDLPLKICRFVFENLLVDERTGQSRFSDFERDVQKMRRLFEAFAFNFFRRHLPHLRVTAPQIDWYGVSRGDPATRTLPVMQTDIVVSSPERALIIDTKFTPVAFHTRYEQERARSGHLYQIFAYVKNYALAHPGENVSGMLLYPVVADPFSCRYEMHDHPIEIRGIDLRLPWRDIHSAMTGLIASAVGPGLSGTASAGGILEMDLT